MVPFESLGMVSYLSAIVTVALSCTVFELFQLNKTVTLRSGLEVIQGHLIWYHLKDWVRFPIRLL